MSELLFLVGMMGTGKSTVGQLVSEKLGITHIDSDTWIESKSKKCIPEIFKEMGEDFFRSQEKNFIENHLPLAPAIISCGGGLCIANGMMDELKKKGVVICLSASKSEILKRVTEKENRPLLSGRDQERKIAQLLDERSPIYQSANHQIETDDLSPEEISDEVIEISRLEPNF